MEAETPGPVPPGHLGPAQAGHPVRGAGPQADDLRQGSLFIGAFNFLILYQKLMIKANCGGSMGVTSGGIAWSVSI